MYRTSIFTVTIAFLIATYYYVSSLSITSNQKRTIGWGLNQCNREISTSLNLAATALERPSIGRTSGPAILERPVAEKTRNRDPIKDKKRVGNDGWEVRIYNDGLNTREHVARCLVQVTGLTEIAAYQTMMQAHQHGMAVVGQWVYERAEMYHEALKKNGIICDMVPVEESDK